MLKWFYVHILGGICRICAVSNIISTRQDKITVLFSVYEVGKLQQVQTTQNVRIITKQHLRLELKTLLNSFSHECYLAFCCAYIQGK